VYSGGREGKRRSADWCPAAGPGRVGLQSIVGGVRIVDGAHLLEADPTWTGAINTEARWRTRVPLTLKDTILLSEILNPEYVSKALR
jgi:hypothetical protein